MNNYQFAVGENVKLFKFLIEKGLKYGEIKQILKQNNIRVNNSRVKSNVDLVAGDKVEIFCLRTLSNHTQDLKFVYQDKNLCVVVKPKGILTTGDYGLEGLTGLLAVHRLDRDTEGLVILAKSDNIKQALKQVFKDGLIKKYYICEVAGKTNFNGQTYTAYLFKDAKLSKVFVSSNKTPGAKQIKTKFLTIQNNPHSSIVKCELITGRTHQIRAHLRFLGFSIIGDKKYGSNTINKQFNENSQRLVCYKLKFLNLTGELQYLSNREFVYNKEF